MTDVIIAIVPAPGHEGLVADGPCHERPPLLYQDAKMGWRPRTGWSPESWRPLALVLHAPGGPRLGMVRLQKALHPYLASVDRSAIAAPPDFEARGFEFCSAWAGAHAAKQVGLASEVLVLLVTP